MSSLMLFFNRKEISYEFYNKYTMNKLCCNKQNFNNKYACFDKPTLRIFFWFNHIKEDDLDFLKLFNHLILLWLITSQEAKISNLGSILTRGIRYFRCIFSLSILYKYLFFNFLNEILLPVTQKNSRNLHYKNLEMCLYSFSDFNTFTNLRLSSNLYLNSVHDKLFMFIKMNSRLNISYYLNCLKI